MSLILKLVVRSQVGGPTYQRLKSKYPLQTAEKVTHAPPKRRHANQSVLRKSLSK